jgi:hypothetical protein
MRRALKIDTDIKPSQITEMTVKPTTAGISRDLRSLLRAGSKHDETHSRDTREAGAVRSDGSVARGRIRRRPLAGQGAQSCDTLPERRMSREQIGEETLAIITCGFERINYEQMRDPARGGFEW